MYYKNKKEKEINVTKYIVDYGTIFNFNLRDSGSLVISFLPASESDIRIVKRYQKISV